MPKLLKQLQNNWLKIVVLFLLAFIPLYPKLPLLDVFGTWVYIRLDDALIALAVLMFFIIRFRKSLKIKNILRTPIVIYWLVGLICLIYSVLFIGPKLADFFPHLALLHYLRRIEYMIVFFLAYDTINKENSVKPYIYVLTAVVLIVVLYGFGQKFFGFPAFLTMNEEFAKGVPLRLPPTARIPSTFGGHYDLAAFLVMMIPIFWSLALAPNFFLIRILFFVVGLISYVLLLLTASRVSFGVYLLAVTVMLIWQKKYLLILPMIIVSFILLNYVSGASERFYKTLRFSDVIVDLSTGQPIGTLDSLEGTKAVVEKEKTPDVENLPKGTGFIGIPTQPVASNIKTIEVYVNQDLATGSGEIATISGSFLIQKALVYDISLTTRFQGEWPKALAAFKRNILLGSGFSVLSVASDGDYLRMLGETGILGTIAYLGIFFSAFWLFFRNKKYLSPLPRSFVIGVFAGMTGIFANAVLIDVFEASKVAYTVWLLLGITVALLSLRKTTDFKYFIFLRNLLTSRLAYSLYIVIAVIVFYGSSLNVYFVADDFTWIKWASLSKFSDIPKFFTDAQGFFYRPLPKLLYFIEYTFFWLKPGMYHLTSLMLFMSVGIGVYLVMLKEKVKPVIAFTGGILFSVLAVHHENVYWISGQSSLLAAMFIFWGIYMFLWSWELTSGVKKALIGLIGSLLILFAQMSYDGMMIAPIFVFLLGLAHKQIKKPGIYLQLLLIPMYWYIRQSAHAVWPSGDYGYNQDKLFVNSLSNLAGYIAAFIVGPEATNFIQSFRVVARPYLEYIKILVLFFCALALMVTVVKRQLIIKNRLAVSWLIGGIVALAAYLALGGIADRYLIVASGFWIVGLAVLSNQLSATGVPRIVAIITLLALISYNYIILKKTEQDWVKAGRIVENTLLKIRHAYFPLDGPKSFLFINTPVKYGAAWVFPTGLTDALWHMFKFNSVYYDTAGFSSVEAAFKYTPTIPNPAVLIFENYNVKSVQKETRIIQDTK